MVLCTRLRSLAFYSGEAHLQQVHAGGRRNVIACIARIRASRYGLTLAFPLFPIDMATVHVFTQLCAAKIE